MAKYERFEDLPVWKEAARLYNRVLDFLEIPKVPISSGFRNQLDRAALSVSNNIAEGYERATTEQLLSFLSIARGSGGEVRSMGGLKLDPGRLVFYFLFSHVLSQQLKQRLAAKMAAPQYE